MIIPSDFLSVERQEGLYYKDNSFIFGKTPMVSRELRADDNHYFYDNTLPEENRIYMEWITTKPEWTSNFTCISREDIISTEEETHKIKIA